MAKSCEISRGFLQCMLSFSLLLVLPLSFLSSISPLLFSELEAILPPPPWDLEYAVKSESTRLFTGRKKMFLRRH